MAEISDFSRNAGFYDEVSDAWRGIFGESFHYGCFESNEPENLTVATTRLTEKLAAYVDPGPRPLVLDIGCGIGQPAFHLQNLLGWKFVGISTSRQGIGIAHGLTSSRAKSEAIRFLLCDAAMCSFKSGVFDLVWMLESAHLIQDKEMLFTEAFRVLKPGGRFALGDVILRRPLQLGDIYRHIGEFNLLDSVFGKARLELLQDIRSRLARTGFTSIATLDISKSCQPTFRHWRENLGKNRDAILTPSFSEKRIADFSKACDVLDNFFTDGTLGYGMAKGEKPRAGR